jgi:hypothetical protein
MKSTGEEKKLQALYSELKAADEQSAPPFARVWNRAASKPRPVRRLNPAWVAVAACLVCAAGLLFAWSRYPQSTPPRQVANVETPNSGPAKVDPANTTGEASPPQVTMHPPRKPARRSKSNAAARHATQLASTRELTREAKAISDWQSPTSTLLSFTDDELFTSLPQLNENASDLKSFLPNSPN